MASMFTKHMKWNTLFSDYIRNIARYYAVGNALYNLHINLFSSLNKVRKKLIKAIYNFFHKQFVSTFERIVRL